MTRRQQTRKQARRMAHARREDNRVMEPSVSTAAVPPQRKWHKLRGKPKKRGKIL